MKSHQNDEQGLTRRRFAGALAGASIAAGFSAAIRPRCSYAEDVEGGLQGLPRLAGTLRADETARQIYAQDYGQIVHKRPRAALLPGSASDVAAMVDWARRNGLRVAARGQGHQPFGQAQVSAGIVIDMRSLRNVHAITSERIDVGAGADWRTVLQATLNHARTPPVLTNYLGLTVGGTLAIGGIGIATLRHGAQVDQVRALEVVTGTGEVLTCSERERADLFQAALAGQGQCAIITRAVLRLVGAPRMVREYLFGYSDVPALLRDLRTVARDDRFDGAVAHITRSADRWSLSLQAVRHFEPPHAPDDALITRGLRPIAGSGTTRDATYLEHADAVPSLPSTTGARADLGLLLRGPAAVRFLEQALPRLNAGDLGAALALRVFFWNRRPFTRALFRLPDAETCVYLAILRAETTDPSAVTKVLAGNRSLFERCRELGGTLYPFAALALTPRDWQQHYRESWRALIDAKARYDPDNVFASGPDLGAERAH